MSLIIFNYYNYPVRKMEAPHLVQLLQLNMGEKKVELPRILKIQGKNGKFSQHFILFKD